MNDVSDQEKEFSDIELCYKAMGLSFSDNPDQVNRTYQKLKDEYVKELRSPDVSGRTRAAENLKQLEELFKTITGSLIYKDYAGEYEKYKALKAENLAARKQKQPVEKEELIKCPYCSRPIHYKLKVCIYCHGKILTPFEQLIEKVFTARNLIVFGVLLLAAAAVTVLVKHPEIAQAFNGLLLRALAIVHFSGF